MGRFMSQQSLSSFIWYVADLLRGDYKQSDYGTRFQSLFRGRRAEPERIAHHMGADQQEAFADRKAGARYRPVFAIDNRNIGGFVHAKVSVV